VTLKEEPRLRVFENRVLRRMFGSKRDEVTAEWRKRHNEALHDLNSHYFAGDKIKKNEIGGACSLDGRVERRVQGFGGETCGKKTTGESQASMGGQY
jgi:hypothetical protein